MSQNLYSNINGALVLSNQTAFKSSNAAVRNTFGLYETMLCRNGLLQNASFHWQRFFEGLQYLGITQPEFWSILFFEKQIEDLVAANNCRALARIRLQVLLQEQNAFFYIEAVAIEERVCKWQSEGISVMLLPDFKQSNYQDSQYKLSHSKHYPLAMQFLKEQGLDDVLLQNTYGNISESAIANLFWFKNGQLFTIPLNEGCLNGTMRQSILNQITQHPEWDVCCIEKSVSIDELQQADEIFLTNAIRKMRWVQFWGQQEYSCALSKQLYQLLF